MVSQAKEGCSFILDNGEKCSSKTHIKVWHNKKPIKRKTLSGSEHFPTSSVIKLDELYTVNIFRKPRKKRTDRAKAKDKAWAAFSMYIRVRDSLKTTGTTDFCVCITCNERGDSTPKPFSKIQAGHAVGGRGNAVLFNDQVTHGQCNFCNAQGKFGLSGDYGNYALALVKMYGLEHAEQLQRLKHVTLQYKTKDFEDIAALYKKELEDLLDATV